LRPGHHFYLATTTRPRTFTREATTACIPRAIGLCSCSVMFSASFQGVWYRPIPTASDDKDFNIRSGNKIDLTARISKPKAKHVRPTQRRGGKFAPVRGGPEPDWLRDNGRIANFRDASWPMRVSRRARPWLRVTQPRNLSLASKWQVKRKGSEFVLLLFPSGHGAAQGAQGAGGLSLPTRSTVAS
jgi:hypothetical protein